MPYESVIGMEVHAELKTKSKMFCDCLNGFGLEKEPNIHICPICTGQPGTLPVINEEAVKMVIKTGVALNCQIADDSFFERKNYFYPDLPKGYQISQYQKPLCYEGHLQIGERRIGITRIHLEEDTGKLTHPKGADYSLVDFNRAGVPLMELVTEPDIRSGAEAKKFCQELQLILRYLGVSDADMERGQMRCEVNISLQQPTANQPTPRLRRASSQQPTELGTKVEIKNLNSFSVVERAIDYEIKRQSNLLERGENVIQETRGWNDKKGVTFSQRVKEEAHDYRYFPEPDLPPLKGLHKIRDEVATEVPELPQAKRIRMVSEYGLPENDVEVFIQNKETGEYFEQVCSELSRTEHESRKFEDEELKKLYSEQDTRYIGRTARYKLTANYLITEIPRVADKMKAVEYKLKDKISAENFAEFIVMIYRGIVSSSGAQAVLEEMFKTSADPSHIIEARDLAQVSDAETLEKIVEDVIKNNPQPVEDYRKGKEASLQFLVGQVMKKTKGKANPQVVGEILKKRLTL
jgi:aspartyl-tRNA(Asn)/glutamyl-tRNA(Gln) amidotransferase subunit B